MDILSSAEFQSARAEVASGRGSNGNCDLNGLPEESSMTVKPLDFDYLTANKGSPDRPLERPRCQRQLIAA